MPQDNIWEKQALVYKKRSILFGVFTLLILTVFVAVWFKKNANGNKDLNFEKKLSRFPLLDPTRNLLEKKDAIINIQPLRENLEKLAIQEATNTRISIYLEFLNTGANITINKDEKIWPVSLAKLPLAMLVMKKVEDGQWKETDTLEILDENLNSGSGNLYKEANQPKNFEVWKLVTEMLINSDNTAYRILKRNTTLQERENMAEEIGLGQLFDDQGRVSAKEYSRLFRALYTASYLNQENSQKILKVLSQNNFKEFLNAGIPLNTFFSHKQGENIKLSVFADSGIVYFDHRPYIISVMLETTAKTGDGGKEYAKVIMQQISKTVFEYIKNK